MRTGTAVKVFKYSYISDLRATIFVKCPKNGVKMGKNAPSTSKKVFKYSYISTLRATIFVKCPENGVKMGKNAPSTSKKSV